MSYHSNDDKEGVPLLSSNKYKYKNRLKNLNKSLNHSKRVSSPTVQNHTQLISDFDHVDSWGMLHESDTDYDFNYDLERGDRLMDSTLLNRNQGEDDDNKSNRNNDTAFIDHTLPLDKDKIPKAPSHMVSYKHSNSNGKLKKKPKNKHKRNSKNNNKQREVTNKDGDVVIDVDALLQHVQNSTVGNSSTTNNNNNSGSNIPIYHAASLTAEDDEYDSSSSLSSSHSSVSTSEEDEYNSRPSSKNSSSSNSSLDDVCLVIDDESTTDTQKMWPDVSVLEEFSKEETERLRRQALEDAERFHFHYDETDQDTDDNGFSTKRSRNTTSDGNNRGIYFSQPIVTNIDVPELGNKRVNETENLHNNGRLRPKRVGPWHLMQRAANTKSTLVNGRLQNVPFGSATIDGSPLNLAKVKETMKDNLLVGRNIQYPHHIISNNPEHFRFAYFRMDLDATVHSPTVSGLLQPGQKFEDLFVSSVYMNSDNTNQDMTSTRIMSPSPPTNNQIINSPMHHASSINVANSTICPTLPSQQQLHQLLNKNVSNISAHTSATNLANNNTTMSAGQGNRMITPSISLEDIPPFWLDVVNPTEEEMKVLSKAFGIHPLTTEDIFLGEVREKVELFKDYYLICFRSFDIVAEKHTRRKKNKNESLYSSDDSSDDSTHTTKSKKNTSWFQSLFHRNRRRSSVYSSQTEYGSINHSGILRKRRESLKKKREEREKFKRKSGDRHKPRAGELEPLNVYIIVFRTGVLTFHFAPTPHPINVRRRARLLKDYLNVTSDWIAYALIDDITDAFGPMIELIEDEVYDIEDAILKMNHSGETSSSSSSSESSSSESEDNITFLDNENDNSSDVSSNSHGLFNRGRRSPRHGSLFSRHTGATHSTTTSRSSKTSSSRTNSTRSSRSSGSSSSISTFNANIIGWKKKGDMLRRIGDCRKRVMSILRLLGAKADVIKGFAKRYNGQWDPVPQTEIGMYLDDIQDHIITMVSSLNHYEKLLSRSHSNYLAQINIDMTKVNNDMNDVLGKITILGTIVLPMNVITGLWGMNVIVPGQFNENLYWFFSILLCMLFLAYGAYVYTKKRFGF